MRDSTWPRIACPVSIVPPVRKLCSGIIQHFFSSNGQLRLPYNNDEQEKLKTKEETVQFWRLMQEALVQVGSRQIEFWELDDVKMVLDLQPTKIWKLGPTYTIYPRLCVYLARDGLPAMELVELHKRLRIQIDDCDKEDLETRGRVVIETDKKKYVLGAREQA